MDNQNWPTFLSLFAAKHDQGDPMRLIQCTASSLWEFSLKENSRITKQKISKKTDILNNPTDQTDPREYTEHPSQQQKNTVFQTEKEHSPR